MENDTTVMENDTTVISLDQSGFIQSHKERGDTGTKQRRKMAGYQPTVSVTKF